MPDMELELAQVDELDNQDMTEQDMDALETLETGEPELELVDPGTIEAPREYMDGRFKSPEELEARLRQLELEREMIQSQAPVNLAQYGFDLNTIPPETRGQLDAAARAYLGQSLEQTLIEVATGRQAKAELAGAMAQKTVKLQQDQLRQHWGEDYEEIMQSVRQEFALLTEGEKSAYDTVNGAIALGSKYQLAKLRGQVAATPQVPKVKSPTMLRSSAPNQQLASPSAYTWEQIERQSLKDPTWYAKNADRISALSKAGRIT